MSQTTPSPSFSRVRRINRKVRPPTARKKSRVHRPDFTDIIFHRRNQRRTQYYITSGHEHLGEARNVNEEQSPFLFPPCSLMFAYYQYWRAWQRKHSEEQRKSSYKEQHSYKTLQSADVLQRLRVDVEIEAEEAKKHKDPDKAIAITDVYPEFFTEISGRVVKEKFSLKQYINDTREVLRTRLLAGYEVDDCIRIEEQFTEEQKILDHIKRQYRKYVSGFEDFLSKDHNLSMEILQKADADEKRTAEITQQRNRLSKQFAQVRLDVYHWEENWRLVKMCQKFLYRISPISWRVDHDWVHRTESGDSIVSTTVEELFGRYRMAEEAATFETLIELFEQDIADPGPTELYFEDPQDLIHVFRAMELLNLNALIHLESLAGPMADMEVTIIEAEAKMKSEIDEIGEAIADLEEAIHITESRAEQLEEYANKLLHGVFRDLICSQDVLFLHVFVEDTYENCIAPNDANLDSFTMMKQIEKLHEELNLQLDTLPPNIVKVCEKEGFRQEMKTMKEAEDAARKFDLMLRLLASLRRMMEPPLTKGRPLMARSAPVTERIKAEPPPPEPTEEELIYLTYFTDYCKKEDFTAYRSQFPDDFDLTFALKRHAEAEQEEEQEHEVEKIDTTSTFKTAGDGEADDDVD